MKFLSCFPVIFQLLFNSYLFLSSTRRSLIIWRHHWALLFLKWSLCHFHNKCDSLRYFFFFSLLSLASKSQRRQRRKQRTKFICRVAATAVHYLNYRIWMYMKRGTSLLYSQTYILLHMAMWQHKSQRLKKHGR